MTRQNTPILRRVAVTLAVGAAVTAAAHLLDPWAVAHLTDRTLQHAWWYKPLRWLGDGRTWAVVGFVLLAIEFKIGRLWRTGSPKLPVPGTALLALSVGIGGLAAEALKPLIGRKRPEDVTGGGAGYEFWSWSKRIPWSDCGIPSSHTAVVFSAAAALWFIDKRLGVLVGLLGCGTALTRIVNANHYFSDTVAGAVLGIAAGQVAAWLLRDKGSGVATATLRPE
ncbi:MAG: phosphatase PAP2 family protein [Phycisphaerales bacterium]